MTSTQPTQTNLRSFDTWITDDARERQEVVNVTSWSDGAVGIEVRHDADDAGTTTYALPEVARSVALAILAATDDVTFEYRPVLVCQPGSRCVRLYGDDRDGQQEHDVRYPGKEFTDEAEARAHAEGMRSKVYGSEHDVVIRTRAVLPWVRG